MTMVMPDRHAADHWVRYARCADHPAPGLWFPTREGDYSDARPICQACPVRVPCLIQGIVAEGVRAGRAQRFGMWGGTTPIERASIVRKLRKHPRATWVPVARGLIDELDRKAA